VSHTTGGTPEPAYRIVVRLPTFERSVREVLSDDEQADLEVRLALHPRSGSVVPGTGGVRKIRVAPEGRGKRGGVRVIYYFHAPREVVFLILAYAKTARDTLTGADRERMRRLTRQLELEP
jgi:hypothetical protein